MKQIITHLRLLFLVSILGFIVSCSTADNSDPPAALTSIENPEFVRQLWSTDSGKGIDLNFSRIQPLLLGSYIYTIDTLGAIQKIDPDNGKKIWSFKSGLAASAGLTGNPSGILATSRNGEVAFYEFTDESLTLKWKKEIRSEILSRAVLSENQVIIRTVDGRIVALDANNGQEQWAVSRRVPALSLTGSSYPIVTDELVISGFDNGKLVAFDLKQGSSVWETTVASPSGRSEIERLVDLDGQFVLRDGVIYISSYQGNLVAVTVSNGQVIWSRKFSSFQAIDIDQDALYLTDDKSHIWAIDRRTGSAFWQQDVLNGRKITAPLVIKDRLVVADYDGYVHWLDKQDGRIVARKETYGIRFLTQPIVQDNKVIVIDSTNQLIALTQAR